MPSTQLILAALPRETLRALLHTFDLEAQDGRKTDSMVKALVKGLPKDRAAWLGKLSVATLKDVVVDASVTVNGSGKAALVAALASAPVKSARKPAAKAAAKPAPKAAGKPATKAAFKPVAKPVLEAASAPAAKAAVKATAKPAAKSVAVKAPVTAPNQAAATKPAKDADAPAATPAAAPRHMLSWSEAVALATKRGQSAASMIGQPAVHGETRQGCNCPECQTKLDIQDCHIHSCDHSFLAQMGRKICAECMFERNNMSVDAFHERLREDWQCPQCRADVPRP